jgi:hypothetical protein
MTEATPMAGLWGPEAAFVPQPAALVDLWEARGKFDPQYITDLPAAAQRYLQHAIAPGTVLATSVKLQMHGEIKIKKWHRFTGEQIIHRTHEFVWRAKTRLAGVPIRGFDRLVNGKGTMHWRAFGILPVMTRYGPRITRSAAGRAIAESVWLPSTLCRTNVRWTALTPWRPHAHVAAQREWAELALKIDNDGALQNLTLLRWGNPHGGTFHYVPFGAVIEAEDTFRGYTIPTRLRIGYYAGTPRFEKEGEFLRISIDNATFL